jgi:hypothetical protein
MIRPRFYVLTLMVLAAASTRLLPHPPNMTAIAAMALFGGARIEDKRLAIAMPLAALFVSDLVLGFHATLPVIYFSFALIALVGLSIRSQCHPAWIAGAALASSVLFFVLSNLGVWAVGGLYPPTLPGLAECFTAALPFFRNSVIGDLIYSGLLFGLLSLLEQRFTELRPEWGAQAA